jgi:hypothetical protein
MPNYRLLQMWKSPTDRIVLAIIKKAINGDLAVFQEIQNTLYGKISDRIALEQTDAQIRTFE